MTHLIPAFFLTAVLYAMVGFGGGSTYNALLVLAGIDYQLLPAIALGCNIIVVSGGAWVFARAGEVEWRQLLPFVVLSIPMAWVGGRLPVPEHLFVGLLGLALLFTAASLLFELSNPAQQVPAQAGRTPWLLGLPVGAAVGMLAGIVGIGGGIFLAPILHFLRWGNARAVAAASSVFILVNSISGLSGQLLKLGDLRRLGALEDFLWLFPAVLVGGQIGSRIGAHKLPGRGIRLLTGLLILFVAVRLLYRYWVMEPH